MPGGEEEIEQNCSWLKLVECKSEKPKFLSDPNSYLAIWGHTNGQQNAETSPESSLPCGQRTSIGSTSITSTPSQHTLPQLVVPPQPATPWSHKPGNIQPHTQSQKTPQSSPTTQSTQQSPIRTNINPANQPFIPATETHQSMSSSPLQHIPKSVNGEGVKSSKQENRSSAPDG